jgi:hypothetical protein
MVGRGKRKNLPPPFPFHPHPGWPLGGQKRGSGPPEIPGADAERPYNWVDTLASKVYDSVGHGLVDVGSWQKPCQWAGNFNPLECLKSC